MAHTAGVSQIANQNMPKVTKCTAMSEDVTYPVRTTVNVAQSFGGRCEMVSVVDVGQWFYDNVNPNMGRLRNQKLTYLAQAWHLAWTGQVLFEEEFRGYTDGPVSEMLRFEQGAASEDAGINLPSADPEKLTAPQIAILASIIEFYGALSTEGVKQLSHDSAWDISRKGLAPDEKGREIIKKIDIYRHYSPLATDLSRSPTMPLELVETCASFESVEAIRQSSQLQGRRWTSLERMLASA